MPPFTPPELALLGIGAVGIGLLISNRVRPDLVALGVLLALGISGLLSPDQALAGFSNRAVLTIAGLFVITAALEQTGVVQWLAERLAQLGGTSEARMLGVFMSAGALLSLLMNNIAAGAVLLPAAVQVARKANVSPAKLLMPLAFGTLLGGMATLFTTANLIVSGALQAQGQHGLTLLDFLPIGGATALAGLAYMLLFGRRLLPNRESVGRTALASANLAETYQLAERLWEVRVQPGSPLVDRQLGDTVLGAQLGVTVVAIWHGREAQMAPAPSDTIAADDILLVLGREERVRQLEAQRTSIGRNGRFQATAEALPVLLSEVVIGPRSPAIGQTIRALRFRSKYGLTAVALWRTGRSYRTDVGTFVLQAGDAILLVGPPERGQALAAEPGFIVLDHPHGQIIAPRKALWAVGITLAALVAAALGVVPTAEAMLAGAGGLICAGCISVEEAYRAIEWRVVVLIAGMLPLGTALVATGLAARIGQGLTSVLAGAGPLALVAGLYLFTVVVTQLVGGQVAALIVGPIAVSAAVQASVNPTAVGVAVSMACSAAFLTPIAHPVNVLMMGPGGYTPGDFPRVGAGLTVVCFLTLLLVLPLLWQL